jgi:glycerol-3-phosphate dehydrogenase subunit B
MRRIVVIGGGLAGLVAAAKLAGGGDSVTLVSEGLGGLQLSQGTIDVYGYNPGRVHAPLAAVAGAPATHPYARIGANAVRDGIAFLQDALGAGWLVGDPEVNLQLPTALGVLRPTALVPPSMAAGRAQRGQRWAIVGFRQLKDFGAELVAGNLARAQLRGCRIDARPIVLDLPPRSGESDASGLVYARAFDDPSFRGRLVAALRPLLDGETAVGLPAVLGLADPAAWTHVRDALGVPVFEIPLPPPGIPGMRLGRRLTAVARQRGVRFVAGSRAIGHEGEGRRLTGVVVRTAAMPRRLPADDVVYAPGGFESGAIAVDSRWGIRERLFGLPLAGLDDIDKLITDDYWDDPQSVFSVGVGVDAAMRPVRPDGSIVYENLFAIGGILAGACRWREKSGEGIALGSAMAACRAIEGGPL